MKMFGLKKWIFAAILVLAFIGCEMSNPDQNQEIGSISSGNIEMVWIPAGTFTRGSDNTADWGAQPAHQVSLTSGFWMGKYQVTQEQYEAVMGTNPSWFTTANGRPPADGETDARRPVEGVSWYDAIVFCNRLSIMEGLSPAYRINGSTDPDVWGPVPTRARDAIWDAIEIVVGSTGYRLPTEAQWEYACRAGTTTAFNDGTNDHTDMEAVGRLGWFGENSGSRTREVGQKVPNAWDLYDMHGNVWEWCWDWGVNYSSAALTNPVGPASASQRMMRGGWWASSDGQFLRSAFRRNDEPWDRGYLFGPAPWVPTPIGIYGFRILRP